MLGLQNVEVGTIIYSCPWSASWYFNSEILNDASDKMNVSSQKPNGFRELYGHWKNLFFFLEIFYHPNQLIT